MTEEQIVQRLQVWFVENTGASFEPAQPFFESGRFDSFDAINLVLFVETTFPMKFTPEDFQRQDFRTIADLARLVHKRINNG